MRFMEPAVAENVMRHHRLREQSFYWQELHNAGQRQGHRPTTTNGPAETQYDNTLQNQFNFSEFAAIFQGNTATANKRIKLEVSESSETSMAGSLSYHKDDKTEFYGQRMTSNGVPANEEDDDGGGGGCGDEDDDDDDDDDQFDEDAVSTDENLQCPDNPDNSKEMNNQSALDKLDYVNDEKPMKKITIANFKMHQEMATNTEPGFDSLEEDSDRMFLLSLLPYLRKVNEQRKLQVRQQLQDVFIKEFG